MASPRFSPIPDELNALSKMILDSAVQVHKNLGPGLLESSYRVCLAHEIITRGVTVECELPLPIKYGGVVLDCGYRLDMLVGGAIIVELKTVEEIVALHQSQLLTYLRHANKRLGLLINFNSVLLKDGIRRVING
jgi:GxxExxY protein